MLYKWIDGTASRRHNWMLEAVIMIWLWQSRCIAKILHAKNRIEKIPYAKIPTDKIPDAKNALYQNFNCPNALQPKMILLMKKFREKLSIKFCIVE